MKEFSELYFSTEYLDLSLASNRRKFITGPWMRLWYWIVLRICRIRFVVKGSVKRLWHWITLRKHRCSRGGWHHWEMVGCGAMGTGLYGTYRVCWKCGKYELV